MHTQSAHDLPPDSLARALGWFSVALGAAELVAPGAMSRLIGAPSDARTLSLIRTMGARELGNGIAILTRPDSAAPLWARVAGDATDLAFLGSALSGEYVNQRRLLTTTAAVVGVTALDVICAQRLGGATTTSRDASSAARITKAVTINKPAEQVYAFWHELANLPRFMRYVESVERLADGRSRWRAQGPGGITVQWDAETIAERENELIAWRSLPGSRIHTSGTVQFQPAPGARGTEVHVEMDFRPPVGAIGRTVAWMSGRDPAQQLNEDLRRLKQLLETGEIAVSEGEGLRRPGRPTGDPERVRTLAGVQP
jgi:uncharacterized membrane protein